MGISILAMHRDEEGKEIFKRYEWEEISSLKDVLYKCEFIACCLERTLYILTTNRTSKRLELIKKKNSTIKLGEDTYSVEIVFESNYSSTFYGLAREMVDFLERTEGKYGWGPDIEMGAWIKFLTERSKKIVDEWYYVYN